mgnify:CR=1 FL=1
MPVLDPEPFLPDLVRRIQAAGLKRVVVVDDGSAARYRSVFRSLPSGSVVLRHCTNAGKGTALKTGLRHVLTQIPDANGVVTADGDGQHLPDDIRAVANVLAEPSPQLVLGTRDLGGDVPWRSRLGNRCASVTFRLLTGCAVADTQSGLRGLPRTLLNAVLTVPGDRYEFELNMLLWAVAAGVPIHHVSIRTVYKEGNRTSHFRPVRDSLTVYEAFLHFVLTRGRGGRPAAASDEEARS